MSDAAVTSRDRLSPISNVLGRLMDKSPRMAADAARSVNPLLRRLAAAAAPDTVDSWSTLTGTGFPFEYGWSSRDAGVRWTAEVAPPETPFDERLALAEDLALVATPSEWRDAWSLSDRTFGVWAGRRHNGPINQGKLYLELPAGLPPGWRGAHPLLRSELLTWRLAGFSSQDDAVELYARTRDMGRAELDGLAAALGFGGTLGAALSEFTGAHEPPQPLGLSVTFAADRAPSALTAFMTALTVFPDEAAATARLEAHAETAAARRLLAALLGGPPDGRWRYGMLGVGVDRAGRRWAQAGVRPT